MLILALLLAAVPLVADARASCVDACKPRVSQCRTECAGQPGRERHACIKTCRDRAGCPAGGAPIRTLAYVQTECRTSADGFITARQSLRIRRGDCEPVTVVEFQSAEPQPDPAGLCRIYGVNRGGYSAVIATPLQRLGVSPDGSAVVFEVTDDHLAFPVITAAPEEEGIWFVRADGSGLRRLGPASRDPMYRILGDGGPIGFLLYLPLSPDGRLLVFTDLGPGPSGEDAVQVVTLDVVSGRRTQLTHFPPVALPCSGTSITPNQCFPVYFPQFVDAHTVLFQTISAPDSMHPEGVISTFTIRDDGTRLRPLPQPVALSGNRVIPTFQLSLTGRGVITLQLEALTNVPGLGPGTRIQEAHVQEAFFVSPRDLIQLTNFGRYETYALFLGADRRRAFFIASADPLGHNPAGDCQLFSIDTLGGHLRQLTRFTQSEPSQFGCGGAPPPGCSIGDAYQDPVTRTVLLNSNCDPFGTNPYSSQAFAMHPDGTGLRQLTAARGFVEEPNGAVSTEQIGQFVSSGWFVPPARRR